MRLYLDDTETAIADLHLLEPFDARRKKLALEFAQRNEVAFVLVARGARYERCLLVPPQSKSAA